MAALPLVAAASASHYLVHKSVSLSHSKCRRIHAVKVECKHTHETKTHKSIVKESVEFRRRDFVTLVGLALCGPAQLARAEDMLCQLKVAPSGLGYCDILIGNGVEASQGQLIKCSKTPMEFAKEVAQEGKEYNGFNLILMDLCTSKIAYVTNRSEGTSVSVQEVSPGLHVLCNAQLDTPWPKVQRLRYKFEDLLRQFGEDEIPETQIIENAMKDTVPSDRTMLPKTGCDPEWEYELSSIFVNSEKESGPYGTRSMVVLSLKQTGQLTFYEQYLEDGKWREHKITYQIELDKVNHESKAPMDEKKGA